MKTIFAMATVAAVLPAASVTHDSIPLAFTAAAIRQPIHYSAYGRGMSVHMTPGEAHLIFEKATLPIRVVGSSKINPTPVDTLPGKANFLLGKDPKAWRTNVETFRKIAYRGVLPGIDLIYYGDSKKLEYDFAVAPGADPKAIQMEAGADWKASITAKGTLLLSSGENKAEFDKPVSYQLAADGSRTFVQSSYRLTAANRFGFLVGKYDRSRPLIIDPVLVYGTYLGGAVADVGTGIAIDNSGNAYITGRTESASFPVTSGVFQGNCGTLPTSPFCMNSTYLPFGGAPRSNAWAFVTKLNPQGTQVLYSTYLGGDSYADGLENNSGGTIAQAISVDGSGNAYIGGQTQSLTFPTTAGAAQPTKAKVYRSTWPGPCAPPSLVDTDPNSFLYDGFVAKLNATGTALLYSTYLGGSDQDAVNGLAISAAGEIFVTGSTHSVKGYSYNFTQCSFDQGVYRDFGFPTTSNAAYPEVIDRRNTRLGFFTKFTPSGAIAYSTYIGNGRPSTAPNDRKEDHIDASKIAVDSSGAAYIAGYSLDELFGGGCNGCASGGHRADAYLIKFNANGTVGYGPKLFGGSAHDYGYGVALDAAGNAYITGSSDNEKPGAEFPTTPGSYQTTRTNVNNFVCPVVVKVSPTGSTLFSTFVCGNTRNAAAYAVAVDPTTQTPVITGRGDWTIPLVSNISSNAATNGVFLARLNSTGTSLLFSSFIGRPSGQNDGNSYGAAVVMDSQMNAYVTGSNGGSTQGTLATNGSFDTTPNGREDAFVSKVSLAPNPPVLSSLSTSPNPAIAGQPVTITLNGTGFDTGLVEVLIGSTVIANASIATKTITQLVLTTTLAAGSYNVTARNASFGTPSNGLALNVTTLSSAPTVSGISPNPASAGSNTFTISGTGFDPATVQVEIGGTVIANASLTTKTATQLVFTTSLQAGSYNVLARNGAAGTASNTVSLTVNGVTTGGSHFVPIAPCRAADTRQTSIMAAGSTRNFSFGNCGVPANATAVALNVTIVPSGLFGYLSIFPAGQSQPVVSTMNSLDGRIKANAAIVGLGANSSASIFVTDPTHAILDVNGYFVPAGTAGALAFYPVTPCRVVDTRSTGGIIPAQGTRLVNGGCLPSNAQAYSLNVTVVPPAALGFLTLWPEGTARPTASTLNNLTGTVVANAAVLRSGTGGAFNAYVTEASHFIADLNGYFGAPGQPGALAFYPSTPCRLFDTRAATGAFGGPAMARDSSRSFTIPSSNCNIPTTAQAYVTNATVVPGAPFGFLTLWAGGQARPTVSVLNAVDGAITSNAAIVPAGPAGVIQAYTSDGTHLLLDISGYFAP